MPNGKCYAQRNCIIVARHLDLVLSRPHQTIKRLSKCANAFISKSGACFCIEQINHKLVFLDGKQNH